MLNILNAVAVTLLAAVVSVFPAALIGQHVPGVFNPTLKPIAVAAWLSAFAASTRTLANGLSGIVAAVD